jgi:hypothetical protein
LQASPIVLILAPSGKRLLTLIIPIPALTKYQDFDIVYFLLEAAATRENHHQAHFLEHVDIIFKRYIPTVFLPNSVAE